jgi:hypothetical protein
LTKNLSVLGKLVSDGVGITGEGRIGAAGLVGVGAVGEGVGLGIVCSRVSGAVGGMLTPGGGTVWADVTFGKGIKVKNKARL